MVNATFHGLFLLLHVLLMVFSASSAVAMMTTTTTHSLQKDCFILRFEPSLSWRAAMHLLASNEHARDALNAAIAAIELDAVFFELPPVNVESQDNTPFEAYITNAPGLSGVMPDYDTFSVHMAPEHGNQPGSAVSFYNLGRDAVLIAPTAATTTIGDGAAAVGYPHLAAFARHAERSQQHAFWSLVGKQALKMLEGRKEPLWLSTSGIGVFWLHVRLDSRPKYYVQKSLRRFPIPASSIVEGSQL